MNNEFQLQREHFQFETYSTQIIWGVIGNIFFGLLLIGYTDEPEASNCNNLRDSTRMAGNFCLYCGVIILLLSFLTYQSSSFQSLKLFKCMLWINGVFPFLYGFSMLIMIGQLSVAYRQETKQEECPELTSTVYFFLIFSYVILGILISSYCFIFTCSLMGMDQGFRAYLLLRGDDHQEPDLEEAISKSNFQAA